MATFIDLRYPEKYFECKKMYETDNNEEFIFEKTYTSINIDNKSMHNELATIGLKELPLQMGTCADELMSPLSDDIIKRTNRMMEWEDGLVFQNQFIDDKAKYLSNKYIHN